MQSYLAGLIIVGTQLLFSCGSDVKIEAKPLRPVAYQKVESGYAKEQRTFNGIAETDKVVNLSFRSSGVLTRFDLDLGQKVKKGQVLATLDNVQSRLAYEQSITQLNSAESQMKTAKLSYDRVRSLYEKGSASLSDFETAKNSYQTARNSFESAKRSVKIQQEQINYGKIIAPDDGVITQVIAELGENIQPGQNVAVLNAGTRLSVRLGIPENMINYLYVGDSATIEFSSINDQVFTGSISEVSPALDQATSTYPIKVAIASGDSLIKSGMAAYVTFYFNSSNGNTIQVPSSSVGEDSDGRFVFVVEPEKGDTAVVKKRYVEIEDLHSTGFVVSKGIKPGELIATAGLLTLLDNQKVQLKDQ